MFVAKKLGPPPKLKGDSSVEDDLLLYSYGLEFKAKMLGLRPIEGAFGAERGGGGDKMAVSEDCLAALKANLAASKRHKRRVLVDVSLNGIVVMEEKNRKLLHRHAVADVLFIALDVSDARNCGYIARGDGIGSGAGNGAGNSVFVGIRSADKTAKDVFTAMQVVVGLACEYEMQQQQQQQQQKMAAIVAREKEEEERRKGETKEGETESAKLSDAQITDDDDAGIDDIDEAALADIEELLGRVRALDARGVAVRLALEKCAQDILDISRVSAAEMESELQADAAEMTKTGAKEEDEAEVKGMLEMLEPGASLEKMGRVVEVDEGVGEETGSVGGDGMITFGQVMESEA